MQGKEKHRILKGPLPGKCFPWHYALLGMDDDDFHTAVAK